MFSNMTEEFNIQQQQTELHKELINNQTIYNHKKIEINKKLYELDQQLQKQKKQQHYNKSKQLQEKEQQIQLQMQQQQTNQLFI